MVYESDFYTVRRPRPTITSYSVTRRQVPWEKVPTVPRPSQIPQPYTVYGSSGNYYSGSHSPRHYVVLDSPSSGQRRAEEQYSYSYAAERGAPSRYYSSSSERVSRTAGRPDTSYSYSTERSSSSSSGYPGSYHSSYSSSTSGRLPGGTTYRHYSYRI